MTFDSIRQSSKAGNGCVGGVYKKDCHLNTRVPVIQMFFQLNLKHTLINPGSKSIRRHFPTTPCIKHSGHYSK